MIEAKIGKKFDDARCIDIETINGFPDVEFLLEYDKELKNFDKIIDYENLMDENYKRSIPFNYKNIKQQDDILSADKLMNQCFNVDNYNVFISHSSYDIDSAIYLQKILAYIGYTSFIDSNVWENVYKIGDNLKYNGYDCSDVDRNLSVILTYSLTRVMDKASKIIFITSENSLSMDVDNFFSQTYSPWIFHELSMLNLLPSVKMKNNYIASTYENFNFANKRKRLYMTFNVKLPRSIHETSLTGLEYFFKNWSILQNYTISK